MTDQPEPMFGADNCTCIPWTRQTNPPRYMKPTDTVDMISGWERGQDCPHHAPVVQPADRPSLRDRIAAPQGPEYTRCQVCGHIEPEHRPDAGACLECECGSYRPVAREDVMFSVPDCTCIPITRKDGQPRPCGPRDTVSDIQGWERGSDCPFHRPAVLFETAGRAAVLREAADALRRKAVHDGEDYCNGIAFAADHLDRMADEAQQPEETGR